MIEATLIVYTLITVTYGGKIQLIEHPTLELCEQTKSIALTGNTVEENQRLDEEHKKIREEWEVNHPWREPKDAYELSLIQDKNRIMWVTSNNGGGLSVKDGKVKETYPTGMSPGYNEKHGEDMKLIRGKWVKKFPTDIKYAKCIESLKNG